MKKYYILLTLALLVACTSSAKLQEAKTITPTGTEFQKALHKEYIDLAVKEQSEGDVQQADFYAGRAITAGSGKRVNFYTVDANGLPDQTVPAFKKARARLGTALDKGARQKAPHRTAKAQAGYDCWLHEVELTADSERIDACWAQYQKNIKEVEEILGQ